MKQTTLVNIALYVMLILVATGCAGFTRGCASCNAEAFGSDWIVVQYGYNGDPINCWKLTDVSITNEPSSDGIYWKDTETGHLIHISGWYNRVQVINNRFEEAAKLLGVDLNRVHNGRYQ